MTPKRITYEVHDGGPLPDVGDVLVSSRSAYLVVSARVMKTHNGSRKVAIGAHRYPRDCAPEGNRWFNLVWNKRTKK